MNMARDGGLVLDRTGAGQAIMRCPAFGCRWHVEVSDLGELVHTGVSEDDLRGHLASHPVEDWLRSISGLHGELRRTLSRLDDVEGIRQREAQRAIEREHRANRERDRAWRSLWLLVTSMPRLIRRCCAEQAVCEVSDALQRQMGDDSPDDDWTLQQARAHLDTTQADHQKGGHGG